MPIETSEITTEQLAKILALEEGHFLDVKSIYISPAKLTKALSAFANADGGELYIGIEERKANGTLVRDWRGFDNAEAANGHVQVFEQLFPLGQDFSYVFLFSAESHGQVLQVSINKTKEIKLASDGKAYVRRGAQSLPADAPEALERLKLNKGLASFEAQTVAIGLGEITNSRHIIEFLLQVIPTAEPENWLRKQQLIRDAMPTVAGILLFAEEPQAILPKRCGVKIYQYRTKEAAGTRETLAFDPLTVDGSIYDQIKDAVQKTVEIVETSSRLGTGGFEKISYPRETLHEIITNAVLHRDYSIADDVHVRIFDNRIEVESPGTLPAHITVKNILNERFARNGSVVRIINKFPDAPNKDVGEGLNTAFEAMRKLKLREPVIEQRENSVIVFIRHEPLARPEELVMAYLESHPQINNSQAREICYIGSENVMKRIFERLMERGLIERIPELKGRATAYRKKPSA
jgi:ATP-dependent DNA helicase RecG